MRPTPLLLPLILAISSPPTHARPQSKPAIPPDSGLIKLRAACDKEDLLAVRRLVAPRGVTISINVFFYNGQPLQEDRARIRPAALKEIRRVCHVFDGDGKEETTNVCKPEPDSRSVECRIDFTGEHYSLTFVRRAGELLLSSIVGTIDN